MSGSCINNIKININIHYIVDMEGLESGSSRSPLLAFCDALMATVLAFGVRPSEFMSLECVKCALEENRIDLLSHWISQDRYMR